MHSAALIRGLVIIVLTLGLVQFAQAGDSIEVKVLEEVAVSGTIAFTGAAVLLPFLDGQDRNEALRAADAIGTTAIVTYGLKHLIDAPRPDGTGYDSFPSTHAATAFAAAAMAADRNPEQAPYWYAGASLIAYSRVRLDRHRPQDVIVGAALGYGIAQLEMQMPQGLLLSPFIEPDTECYGVEVCWEF